MSAGGYFGICAGGRGLKEEKAMDQNFMTNNYNMQPNHTVQMQMYEQQMEE